MIDLSRFIVLTGLPRSGTSMLCRMLTQVDDVVALNEGLVLGHLSSPQDIPPFLHAEFERIHAQLRETRMAPARHEQGRQVDNHFNRSSENRQLKLQKSEIAFDKPLSPCFTLAIKHNAIFTLALESICAHGFRVYAQVRNPLAVLGSWNTLNIPVSRGKVRKMEVLDSALNARIEQVEDLQEKQIILLDDYFKRYRDHLDQDQILHYEQLCASPSVELSKIVHAQVPVNSVAPVESLNHSELYDSELMRRHFEMLLKMDEGAGWRHFYTEDELFNLIQQ